MALQTATNPQTGERIVLINGQWVPFTQSATNTQGQKAFLVNNQWVFDQSAVAKPEPEEESGFLRQAADVPLGLAKGAVSGVRMVADAFGANSPVSQTIKGAEDYLAGLMSAESRKDSQEIARIMQDAEDKGMGEQVKAALQAFMTAPVDLLAQGLGTAAPVVLSTLGAKVLGAGALATKGIGLGLGAGMGAGVTKGTIYEETKKALLEAKVPEEQAEARAQLAQSYGGENLDMILAGTALGGLASTTGIEKALAGPLARGILARAGAAEGAEQAVQQGLARRVATGALTESVPEVLQAGQEQLAANIALQREGFDVDTMRGVVGAAALEGLVGAGLGAGVGAIPSGTTAQQPPPPPREEPLPETPEAPIPPAATAAPEVEQVSTGVITAEDIEAAGVDFPRGFMPFVRRSILGKTRSQLQAEVEANPELIEGEAPSARLIRTLLQPQPAADQFGVGLPVQQPAGAPTGIGAPEPGAVVGAGRIAQPPVVPQAPVTPTVTEIPRGTTTPQAIEAEAQRPQEPTVEDLTAPEIDVVTPPATPAESWNVMTPETRQRVAQQAGISKPENFGNKNWGALSKANREKLAGSMLTAETEPTTSMPGKRVESEEEAEAMEAMMALERRGNQIRRDDKSLISKLRGIGLTAGDLKDVYGRKVPIYAQNLRAKGKPGTDLSSLVADGILDDWLPFNMRLGMSGFDEQAGVEYIKQRLMQQDYLTEEAKMALREIDLSMQDLEQVLRLEDINAELDLAAQEQRESGPTVEEDTAPTEDRDTERTQASQDLRRRADAARAAAAERGVDVDAITEEVDAETRGQDDDAFRQRLIERLEAAPDLELAPPTPEAQAEAERRAAQAPADQERDQIRRESEVGAGQFRLEGGEGRQDISGTLFQQEGGGGFNPDPAETKIQQEIEGKTFEQLTQWAVDNAPNRFAKAIAVKVQQRIAQQAEAGVSMSFVIEAGKTRSAKMYSARGMVNFTADPSKPLELTLTLNGAAVMENQSGYPSGMRYSTVLHELIHMATLTQINMLPSSHPLIKQLNELRNEIVKEFNYRARKGKLSDFEQRIYKRSINALSDPDEVIAWGLADADMQEFLASVKVGDKTLFDKFVDWARKVLGLERPYLSALDEVIRTSDLLLAMPVADIAKGVTDRGFMFGPEPVLTPSTTEMVQGSLFQQDSAMPVANPDAVKGEEAKDAARASRESILYKPVDATWDNVADPKEFKLSDTFFYNWIDKQVDLRRVVDAIKATGRRVDYKWNALEKERTYHGRVAKRTKDYLTNELEPTVELMAKYGISQREIGEYLLNRHAPEANAQIALRNPAFPDGGSSIDTADAIAYMNNLDPARKKQLDEVAKRMDKTLERMQDYLVESGLEKAETIQGWRDMFQFYIPLAREDGDFSVNKAMSQGSGYSQSGSVSKSRTGSTKEINLDQIFSTIAMQHEQMIVKAERNRVGNASFGLALQNPNPKFWLALDPETNVVWKQLKKVAALREDKKLLDEIIESGNLTPSQREMYKMEIDLINRLIRKELQPARSAYAKARDDLVELGFKPEEANQMVEQIMMPPMTARYDKAKNEVVYTASSAINNPFVFATRVNGSDKYILFNGNDERAARMATSMKNMDAADLGPALSKVATITRYFAAINTQYNPVFGAYNFLRDMQTAALQISTTEIADERSKVLSGAMPAMKALWQQARGERSKNKKDSEWARDIEEFESEGGQTGFRDLFSQKEERAAAIQRMIDPSSWADSGMGKFFTAGGKLKVPFEVARKGLAPLFDVLTDYNNALENAVRLSAYKVARDKFIKQGMEPAAAKQRAAVIAKDITVNFNQKGAQATQMGALFAFFNASVQGTYMMAKTLAGPLGKTIIGGGLLWGSIQAIWLAAKGFDDEEPPEFVKQRNFVLPYGDDGKYFAFPMPLGFNVIPSISRIATEWVLSGGENGTKKALDLLDVIMDMYNPIGNAGLSLQTIMPTVLDPIAALAENKDWTGKQIAREDFSGLNPTPGFTRSRDSSSVISQELSRYLNYLSGGTDAAKGAISPTADQIDYLIGQLTGGVGREALKLAKTVETQFTGEELPSYSIPLIGRFFGNVNENAAVASAFYRNLTELNVHKAEIDDIREKKGNVQEYLRENPEARLVQSAQAQYRNIQNLKKLRRELLARDEKDRAKKVEERINQQMKRLNERYREVAG